ncbi:hypothetical protein BTO04_02635 [Polaribacter sp. SA4-10]|nr:hypothetical protein BTO04_02635 [Polaribacter sp. SA4-10]
MTSCNKDNKVISSGYTTLDYTKLPTDVEKIPYLKLNNWFVHANVILNGEVLPANSVAFNNGTNIDFYEWSEQMFLWITSPQDSTIVLETREFYTVSPPDSLKKRNLIPHHSTKTLSASVNIMKLDSEEGQAGDGDVLMSKEGSLIYYITFVNDVYAQFLTAGKQDSIKYPNKKFPTTQTELDAIKAFAKGNGETLKSPNTLSMELKTSWVDLATIPTVNKTDYITVKANVPIYDKKIDTIWTPTGNTETKTLALIGMHVVGSVNGHPEMIWATFEHQHNSPSLGYKYIDANKQTRTIAADTGDNWLLNKKSTDTVFNIVNMKYGKTDNAIEAKAGKTITASNTKRINAFGVAYDNDYAPNNENNSTAASNSQIIAINNTVRNQLIKGDVRKNYIFIGATWTQKGAAPTGKSYSVERKQTSPGVAVGASQLANSTMETYFQYGAKKFNTSNASCFACHSNSLHQNTPNALSHIYSELKLGTIITANSPIDSKALATISYK